jgi:DNA-binding NarL/FixJ family response regulator
MKALLLEDHPLCQQALAEMLRARVGKIEIECVTTVDAALLELNQSPRQLVVVAFATADVCGQPGLEGIVKAAGDALVVALDERPILSHVRRALAAGVKGYIPKTSSRELIDAALGVVLAGGTYIPELAATPPAEPPPRHNRLSPRQIEVLELLHKGFSNSEIARVLEISVATAKLHVHAILKATGARNRTALLVRTLQHGSAPNL